MKTIISTGLALLAAASVQAQVFGPRAVNGALLGGIAGAVIGHNSGSLSHNGWQGAAIGAGVGALIGAAGDRRAYYDNGVPATRGDYVYRDGYRGSNRGGSYYGGSAAHNGVWAGGIAGGIIGHNSGGNWRHNGWRGAAWSAGAGWLLGSIIDSNRYYDSTYDYPYYFGRTVAVPASAQLIAAPQPAPAAPAPQQVTIINNYYGNASPMAGANSLFGR